MTTSAPQATACRVTTCTKEAQQIAQETFIYFYSLMSMEVTRRQCTNLEAGKKPGFGPVNTFAHIRAYPSADFKTVVKPNFDTLYSSAWLDISKEPVIVSIPDTNGRYYLLPMLDMWSDVFASPGWRTSGTGEQKYAIVLQGWQGKLPEGVERIVAPTPHVWIIGRTKTDGPEDYAAVNKLQDQMSLTLLSQWGKPSAAEAPFKPDSTIDMETPPLEFVNSMKAKDYFETAAKLMKTNPPHLTDWSLLERISRIGLIPGEDFDITALSTDVRDALEKGVESGLQSLQANVKSVGRLVNGWIINTDSIGVYGSNYLKRAIVSMVGLGANQPEDAIYPLNVFDSEGKPLNGSNNYVLHFDKDQLPPVDAFWSVTMYDSVGYQAANELNRFAISSWMDLKRNADGSLDLYLQNANPGKDKEANWLPAPKTELGVTMRLYAPQASALNGSWAPPAIKRV
jgi:hypothetical protein